MGNLMRVVLWVAVLGPVGEGAPDWDKLEVTLKQHKQSSFFSDRRDLELAVAPAMPGSVAAQALGMLCKVGFVRPALLPAAELSAKAER